MTDVEFVETSFRYRSREPYVLHQFNLTIPAGRTILLGPNGAGKSTILGLAASVLRPDRGRVAISGLEARGRKRTAEYRRRVSYMPQVTPVASGLTTREQVALHGWLAGMTRADAWRASLNALRRVDLEPHADRAAAKLSGGQRARMGLAQALVHAAELLLLDEPTAPLDPDQREIFNTLLTEVANDCTVVVSSHDVAELATSYDHVSVVAGGQVAFHGTTSEFLQSDSAPISAVEAYRTAVRAV